MDTKKSLPESFTLTGRVTTHEDETDIELRTPTEKFTIAENVDDRFAPLFLASPDLLKSCEEMVAAWKRLPASDARIIGGIILIDRAEAAVAKARGL